MHLYKYYLTKNWLKNIYKLMLKYALIEVCFRFSSWRSSSLFVMVGNISWVSSSKTEHRFILSSIVIISLKPMFSCSNTSILPLLPSSLEISLTWWLSISGFWIALMLSSLTHWIQGFWIHGLLAQTLEHFRRNWHILQQIYP